VPAGRASCIFPRKWKKGNEIGKGTFGRVFKVLDQDTMEIMAMKEMEAEEGASADKLHAELSLCRSLRHPHIISYLGHEFSGKCVRIFLEFADGGSVSTLLKEFGPLAPNAQSRATLGILAGLDYLHTLPKPVLHRDIKGANVLVTCRPFCAKLSDFGVSKTCEALTTSFSETGTPQWMAPEVIEKTGYGRKADIWSFGCTIIEMATAEAPWGAKAFNNRLQAMYHIARSGATPPVPQAAPPELQSLIRVCTRREPEARPSTTEVLAQHVEGLADN